MRVWRHDPTTDVSPDTAQPSDLHGRVVLVAAPDEESPPRAWMTVDDYDQDEATVMFGAPSGDCYRDYLRALFPPVIEEATKLGYKSLLAHWRAGWSMAEDVLKEHEFSQSAPGIWRRPLPG